DICPAGLAHHAIVLAGLADRPRDLGTYRVAEAHMGHDPVAEERGHAVERAVNELVGDHEVSGLVFFLEGAHGRNRNNAFHTQLFHAMNVGAKVKLAGKNAVSAAVPGKERDFAAFQRAQYESVRGFAKRRLQCNFANLAQPGHRVQTAAADDANLCLLQKKISLGKCQTCDYNEGVGKHSAMNTPPWSKTAVEGILSRMR